MFIIVALSCLDFAVSTFLSFIHYSFLIDSLQSFLTHLSFHRKHNITFSLRTFFFLAAICFVSVLIIELLLVVDHNQFFQYLIMVSLLSYFLSSPIYILFIMYTFIHHAIFGKQLFYELKQEQIKIKIKIKITFQIQAH